MTPLNEFHTNFKKGLDCSVMQLRYQSRTGTTALLIIALLMIPLLALILSSCGVIDLLNDDCNSSVASIICCESIAIAVFSAILCTSASVYSHNNRISSFLTPLPIRRSVCLIGLFLPGFLITTVLVLGAYGIAIAFVSPTGDIYVKPVLKSIVITICYVFFCCSLSLLISAVVKHSPAVISIITSLIALPLIGVIGLSTSGAISKICSYFPCFASDMAIDTVGTVNYNLYPSIYSFSNMLTDKLGTYCNDGIILCIISLLIGLIFIGCSCLIIERRDL